MQFNVRGRTLLIFSSQGQEVDVHKVGKGRWVGSTRQQGPGASQQALTTVVFQCALHSLYSALHTVRNCEHSAADLELLL